MHRGLSARSRRVNRCRLLGVSAWAPARHPQADASRAGVAGLLRLAPVGPAVGRGGWPHHVSDDDFAQQKAAQRRRGFLRQTPMANACDKISVAQAGVAAPAAVASYRGPCGRAEPAAQPRTRPACRRRGIRTTRSRRRPGSPGRPASSSLSCSANNGRHLEPCPKKGAAENFIPRSRCRREDHAVAGRKCNGPVKIRGTTGARSRSSQNLPSNDTRNDPSRRVSS